MEDDAVMTHECILSLLADTKRSQDARIVRELLDSLSEGKEFPVSRLLELSYASMHQSLELLEGWHLQRYRYRRIQDYLNDASGVGVGECCPAGDATQVQHPSTS